MIDSYKFAHSVEILDPFIQFDRELNKRDFYTLTKEQGYSIRGNLYYDLFYIYIKLGLPNFYYDCHFPLIVVERVVNYGYDYANYAKSDQYINDVTDQKTFTKVKSYGGFVF